jgi:hypothetical protein
VLVTALERILRIRDQSDRRVARGQSSLHADSEVIIAHFLRDTPRLADPPQS